MPKIRKHHVPGAALLRPIGDVQDEKIFILSVPYALKSGAYNMQMGFKLVQHLIAMKSVLDLKSEESAQFLLGVFQAINSIRSRFDKTGKWRATGDELRLLEERLPVCAECCAGITRGEVVLANREFMKHLNRIKR